MRPITDKDTLKSLEAEISGSISNHEYWGDLNISYDEFVIIGDLLREKIQSYPDTVDLDGMCRHYPCVLTTYCVFLVRYKYDTNFWGLLSDELKLKIDHQWQSEIGSLIRRTFLRLGFDYSDVKDDIHTNLAPIIYEACLPPDSSLDDLFYILNYDSHSVFDPEIVIDELIEMRSYLIRKPLLKFLNRFKNDKAVDFLLEIHDTIINVNQHSGHESRYQKKYIEWKDKEKDKSSIATRKKKESQTRPYLFFDNGKKGLCLVLPRIVINTEWTEEVIWTVLTEEGYEKKVYCKVFSDDNVRYVESHKLAVSPSEKYNITMDDGESLDEKSTMKWEINGISIDKPIIFNSNGRFINSPYLQRPYSIFVYNNSATIKGSEALSLERQFYPTDEPDFSVLCVTPVGGDAYLTYESPKNKFKMTNRPNVDLSLDGKRLFSLDKDNFGIELFSDIPQLSIKYEDGNMLRDIEIRINDNRIILDQIDGEDATIVDLKKILKSKDREYGLYSVRIYQYDRFIKQIEFGYVPSIKTDYSANLYWPDKEYRDRKKIISFKLPDHWEIEFENSNVIVGNDKTEVEYYSDTSVLHGILKYKNDDRSMRFCFDLPVNPYEMHIYNSTESIEENVTDKIYKVDLMDYCNENLWLELSLYSGFKKGDYELQLINANGVEQTEAIKIFQNGSGNINLNAFYDSLNSCPLPARIVLVRNNNESVPIIYIDEHMVLSKKPRRSCSKDSDYISLSVDDGEIDINVTRFGATNDSKRILYSESKLSNNKPERGYPYKGRLEEGIYLVTKASDIDDSIFDDNDSDTELSINNNVLYVPYIIEKGIPIDDSKKWLDEMIKRICQNRFDDPFLNKAVNRTIVDKISVVDFDDVDIEKLVALAYIFDSKIPDASKAIIKRIMQTVSICFLQRGDRIRIIRLLVDMNVPQTVFDICVENYSLLLFYGDKKEAKRLATEVIKYSVDLAMLLSMSSEASVKECVLKDKYRDLIGKDAIKYMLSVPKAKDDAEILEQQKRFLHDYPSTVKIRIDDNIIGSESDIQSMQKYDKFNNVKVDISQKPDRGLYFAHIRYIDQYVNWFKLNCENNGVKPEVRAKCKDLFGATKSDILSAIKILEANGKIGKNIIQYHEALYSRCANPNASDFSINLYFYIQGLAALLAKIPTDFDKYDIYRNIGIQFMSAASEIAPRLSRRDILMAGTFVYLKRKEEELCR